MKKGHLPDAHTSHPNVTPLIDIVMCLIIFYMLVAKIGIATGAEAMDIPKTILGQSINDMGNTLTLNVRGLPGRPDPFVTALVKKKDGSFQQTELKMTTGQPDSLQTVLDQYRQGNPDFKVIIRGEANMTYGYLEPVLLACSAADVKNVNFNTAKVTSETAE